MYGILSLPGIALLWINRPLYGLILDGDDLADADFMPVSVGFCVICFLSLIAVVFVWIAGKRKCNLVSHQNNDNTEKSTAQFVQEPTVINKNYDAVVDDETNL